MRALAILVTLLAAAPVQAATFTTERLTDGRVALHMHGIIQRGDEVRAAAVRQAQPTASLFLLDSMGGDVWTSLELARTNSLPTEVRTGERCASACATVWVAARDRYIEPGASVGFHQISETVYGRVVPAPWATATIAEWYRRRGFSEDAIHLMTMAPISEVHWIDDYDAAHGIAFAPRRTTSGTPIDIPPATASRDVLQQVAIDLGSQPKRVATFEVHPDEIMVPNARSAEPQDPQDQPKPTPKPVHHTNPRPADIHF